MWLGWLMLCGVDLGGKERRGSKVKFCDGIHVSCK